VNEKLFDPARMPARVDGSGVHPDVYLEQWYDDDTRPEQDDVPIDTSRLKAAGWDVRFLLRSDDQPELVPTHSLYDVVDESWFASWDPKIEGWQCVAYYDSPDGPAAMFIRPLN
jgi:hypothetical protein